LRAFGRVLMLVGIEVWAVLDYFFQVVWVPAAQKRRARAAWMQRQAKRHLRLFSFSVELTGPLPQSGLLVSNHLSYLDIILIGSLTPAVFVSKADVRQWPVFGLLAKLAGTVFIERERRLHVGEVNGQIASALADGLLVVIFPEGTSTDGSGVLPFRSPLLEPVAGGDHEITVGRLRYLLPDGDGNPGQEVCYWGDHVFFPHLLNLLGKRRVKALVRFGKFGPSTADRKELARRLQTAVAEL